MHETLQAQELRTVDLGGGLAQLSSLRLQGSLEILHLHPGRCKLLRTAVACLCLQACWKLFKASQAQSTAAAGSAAAAWVSDAAVPGMPTTQGSMLSLCKCFCCWSQEDLRPAHVAPSAASHLLPCLSRAHLAALCQRRLKLRTPLFKLCSSSLAVLQALTGRHAGRLQLCSPGLQLGCTLLTGCQAVLQLGRLLRGLRAQLRGAALELCRACLAGFKIGLLTCTWSVLPKWFIEL